MTICLNMIVKNEADVIARCLESVRPILDSWVIVDTGSTDATKQIIRDTLQDVPGDLIDRPWRNFGENRSEAIELAKGKADYLLFIDADDELLIEPNFIRPPLTSDAYSLQIEHGTTRHWRAAMVATRRDWRYVGVLHEYLETDGSYSSDRLDGLRIRIHHDGGRGKSLSTEEKYARDACTLEQALTSEPDNRRYAFYLAQSYRDAGQPRKALAAYERRAAMGGWDEEVWYARYQVARLSDQLRLPPERIVHRYLEAYQARPTRAEPLVGLARHYRESRQFALAHLFASRAISLKVPGDSLFVDIADYQWRAIDEFAVASYWIGDFRGCAKACEQLLKTSAVPLDHLPRIAENLRLAEVALARRP